MPSRHHTVQRPLRYSCERLERRILLYADGPLLFVNGTSGNDNIEIRVGFGFEFGISVFVNGQGTFYPDPTIGNIVVNTLGGNDQVYVAGLRNHDLTINFGIGRDTATFNENRAADVDLNGDPQYGIWSDANVSVHGGGGSDTIVYDATNDFYTPDNHNSYALYTIDGGKVEGGGYNADGNVFFGDRPVEYTGTSNISLMTMDKTWPGAEVYLAPGLTADTNITTDTLGYTIIAPTGLNAFVQIKGGSGDDTLDLSSGALKAVDFIGGGGFNTLNVGGIAAVQTFDLAGGFLGVDGRTLSVFQNVQDLVLNTRSAADKVYVAQTVIPTTITSTGAANQVYVGDNSTHSFPPSTQTLTGSLTILNTFKQTTVSIDDSADPSPRTVTMDDSGFVGFGTISGLSPAPISYQYGGTSFLSVTLGAKGATVNVLTTGAQTVLAGGRNGTVVGPDTFNVGAAGSTQGIAAPLTFLNSGNSNTITLDDSADAFDRTVTLSTYTPLFDSPYGRVSGLAPAYIDYRERDTASLTVKTGTGANTINVSSSGTLTALFGNSADPHSGGGDTINVGSGGTMQNITAPLNIDDPTSFDSITLNDTLDAARDTVTIATSTPFLDTPWDRISGLAPAAISFEADDVAYPVTVDGGSGNDSYLVQTIAASAMPQGPVGFILNLGGGNNAVEVKGLGTGTSLTVNGKAGDDSLTVDYSTGAIDPASAIAFDGGGGSNTLSVTGSAADAFTITSGLITRQQSALHFANVTAIDFGTGSFTLTADLGLLDLTASGSTLRFAASQQLAGLHLIGGSASLAPGGANSLSTSALSIAGGGRLDLADNALRISYPPGQDPIAGVRALLSSGYAGGAWNGPGIVTGAADPRHGLGFADSTDGALPALGANTILIQRALYGDATLAGHVNFTDLVLVARNFGRTHANWDQGDFNYDGAVGFDDLVALARNYGAVANLEPVSAMLMPTPVLSTGRRKRR